MSPVIVVILVIQLFLPGKLPIHEKHDMPSVEACLAQAEAFLSGFALSRNGEGGDAVAICHVKKAEGLPT